MAPDGLLQTVDPMYRISTALAGSLPGLLARNDQAVLFVHYNVPHYPAAYAQRTLGLPPTPDDAVSYAQNLQLVDRIIGQVVQQTMRSLSTAPGQELLLILTSDHWHRTPSMHAARRIPFLAWHAGESNAVTLSQPISTLHTADLVVDFLAGRVTTQAQVARWWHDKPVYPTWIPSSRQVLK
jgi:hypothetical protein